MNSCPVRLSEKITPLKTCFKKKIKEVGNRNLEVFEANIKHFVRIWLTWWGFLDLETRVKREQLTWTHGEETLGNQYIRVHLLKTVCLSWFLMGQMLGPRCQKPIPHWCSGAGGSNPVIIAFHQKPSVGQWWFYSRALPGLTFCTQFQVMFLLVPTA